MNLITEAELADLLHLDDDKVAALRRKHQWPHVRMGRYSVQYTEEQVATIVEMHTTRPKKTTQKSVKGLPGQTPRSARQAS